MKKKVLIVLSMIFIIQTIISCCNCGEKSTYENVYNAVIITPYDNSGFSPVIVTDTVYKNAFGLGVSVDFDSKEVACNTVKTMGFNSAMAFSCDCDGDEYLYPDPISYIKVYIVDPNNKQKQDVSDCFKIRSYNEELLSFDEFFAQREEWNDGFQLELEKYDSIPNSTIFAAEAFLESGKSFFNQTNVVNFYVD